MLEDIFKKIEGFDWDIGNDTKNYAKHDVSTQDAEEIFVNKPLLISDDAEHSMHEKRFKALGINNYGRELLCVFTIRKKLIRIISCRDMNKKERSFYEKAKKEQ